DILLRPAAADRRAVSRRRVSADAGGAVPDLSADRDGPQHCQLLAPLAGPAVLAVRADVVFVAAAVVGRARGGGVSAPGPAPRGRAAPLRLCAPTPWAVFGRVRHRFGDGLCAAGGALWADRLVPARRVVIAAQP